MTKQISFLLAVFLISFFTVNGQHWQTVRSGRIAYFDNDQGWVKCIRIDSVKFDTDSVLYPMPNIQQVDYSCFIPKGNSWIGKKVIIQGKGINLFFNNEKDTIRINTLAGVNHHWTVFEMKDSIKVIAEVLSAGIQTILGEADSVKTIGFQVYEKNILATHHPLSGKTLVLSKNCGFVKTMNFKEFPEDRDFTYEEDLRDLNLIGLTNPDLGLQNLTWLGVYDFQKGDELHILKESCNWSDIPGYSYTRKTRLKYLERKESKDTVFYKVEKEESILRRIERWDSTSYSYTLDTITEFYLPDTLFDKLPGEPIYLDNMVYANTISKEDAFVKKYNSIPIIDIYPNDSCWYYMIFDGGGPGYYIKGLGGYYYEWSDIISGGSNTLVYYKKGSKTWGTPFIFTNVESIEKANELNVYPNPASDFIIIKKRSEEAEKYIISLTDMQGREVFRKEISISNIYRLDISSQKPGAYLLKLQNQETLISRVMIKKP